MSARVDCDLCDKHLTSGDQVVTLSAPTELTDFCVPCWPTARDLLTPERLPNGNTGLGVFVSLRTVR